MALHEWEKSLGTVLGKKIVDVAGWVSAEYGEDTLTFQITRILFDDGTAENVEGEHDFPYIPSDEEHQALFQKHYVPD